MIKNKDFLFSHFLLIRSFNQHFSQKQTILIISWLKFIENRHSICLNPYRGQFNSESPNWLSLLASVFLTVNNAVSDYNTVLNLFFNQYFFSDSHRLLFFGAETIQSSLISPQSYLDKLMLLQFP